MPAVPRLDVLAERARGTFWILPGVAVLVALVVGVVLPTVERAWTQRDTAFFFGGGPDGARAVLSTVAGSTITVTSLTFSLTMVTLQLAASQFSPRLLRSFLRDLRNQSVLGLLLATFTFSLVVLLSVRSAEEGDAFVPSVAVTLALVLALSSVLGLVWFIGHVVEVCRVDRTMDQVAADAMRQVRQQRSDVVPAEVADDPSAGRAVHARRSGFVQVVDEDRLLGWASERSARVEVVVAVGAWVVVGQPLLRVVGDDDDDAADELSAWVVLGSERTGQQDVLLGISLLVDIALRALSPAMNDPTTATTAAGHLGTVLATIGDRPLGPYALRDGGQDRLRVARPSFDDVLDQTLGPLRRSGADEPQLLEALLQVAGVVGEQLTTPDRREALLRHVAAVERVVETADFAVSDVAAMRARVARARSLLATPR